MVEVQVRNHEAIKVVHAHAEGVDVALKSRLLRASAQATVEQQRENCRRVSGRTPPAPLEVPGARSAARRLEGSTGSPPSPDSTAGDRARATVRVDTARRPVTHTAPPAPKPQPPNTA
jgi:hypothetical protein